VAARPNSPTLHAAGQVGFAQTLAKATAGLDELADVLQHLVRSRV
jgi:hypothetical protein